MNGCYAIYSLLKKRTRPGFFLLELQVSIFLTILVLSLSAYGIQLGWRGWTSLSAESEMRDCSRYILSRIDKDVGIGARLVRVKSDNPAVIEVETLDKKHIIRFYCEKRRIYRRIVTRAGSGVNPLYINDVFVEDWHVRTLGEKRIMVSYRLKMGNHSQYFQQLIFCHNGIVQDSGV